MRLILAHRSPLSLMPTISCAATHTFLIITWEYTYVGRPCEPHTWLYVVKINVEGERANQKGWGAVARLSSFTKHRRPLHAPHLFSPSPVLNCLDCDGTGLSSTVDSLEVRLLCICLAFPFQSHSFDSLTDSQSFLPFSSRARLSTRHDNNNNNNNTALLQRRPASGPGVALARRDRRRNLRATDPKHVITRTTTATTRPKDNSDPRRLLGILLVPLPGRQSHSSSESSPGRSAGGDLALCPSLARHDNKNNKPQPAHVVAAACHARQQRPGG